MKLHATERMRIAVNDAMDIHGGKAVIDGPHNYLGNLYRAVPIGITVEGANILTRSLIVFGQGAIRCHPYLLKEMMALDEDDRRGPSARLRRRSGAMSATALRTLFRAFGRSWTLGPFAPAPDAGDGHAILRQLSRYSSAFALCADMALLTLGGALKRKEMLSARLGDILAELYLLSAALKRWQDEGREGDRFAAVEYCMAAGFPHHRDRVRGNDRQPAEPLRRRRSSSSWSSRSAPACSVPPTASCINARSLVLEPSAARDRLTPDLAACRRRPRHRPAGDVRSSWSPAPRRSPSACAPPISVTGKRRRHQGRDHASRGRAARGRSRRGVTRSSRSTTSRRRRCRRFTRNPPTCISSSRNSVRQRAAS